MLRSSFTFSIFFFRFCAAQFSNYPSCVQDCFSLLSIPFCPVSDTKCLCSDSLFLAAWTGCAWLSCNAQQQETSWRTFVSNCRNTGVNIANMKPEGFGIVNANTTSGDPRQQEQSPPDTEVVQGKPSPTKEVKGPSETQNISKPKESLGIASTLPDALNSLPTALPNACGGADWEPTPDNWLAEDVDTKLAKWWSSNQDEGKFVETLFKSFGDKSGGVQCGIGFIETCPMPSCESFRTAKDPKWAYFAQVSIVRLNTLFNGLFTAITYGQVNFNSIIPHLVTLFKPYNDPRTKLQKAMPFVAIAVEGIVGAIPFVSPAAIGTRKLVAESGKLLAEGGAKVFSAEIAKQNVDPNVQRDGNIEELGLQIKEASDIARTTVESWVSTLFSGETDTGGRTLLEYLSGGAHTQPLSFTLQKTTTFYTNVQISKVWNDQVRNNTKTFVMCANSNTPINTNDEEYYDTSLKKRCKLYRFDDKSGDFTDLFGIDGLKEFDIKASDVAASSLRTYRSSKFQTSDDQVAFEQSLATAYASTSTNPEDESAAQQPLNQGMRFGGIFNMPVCDLGNHEDWLDDANFPCCCGTDCQDQAGFMEALGVYKWKNIAEKCKDQYSGWDKVDYGSGGMSLLYNGHFWADALWAAAANVVLGQLI